MRRRKQRDRTALMSRELAEVRLAALRKLAAELQVPRPKNGDAGRAPL